MEDKNTKINEQKLDALNNQHKIISFNNRASLYKRFLALIANNDVARTRQLISVCINHGNGINEIINKLTLAINNLYKPKSYLILNC